MSTQTSSDERCDVNKPEAERDPPHDEIVSHDSDDEPMVYETPRDYAGEARRERERLLARGASPDSCVLLSELKSYVPREENETPADFAKRYSEKMTEMIRSGVLILNDLCVADRVPDQFRTQDGRVFDLGPVSGATKREYREFGEWYDKVSLEERIGEVPQRWLRFEKASEGTA